MAHRTYWDENRQVSGRALPTHDKCEYGPLYLQRPQVPVSTVCRECGLRWRPEAHIGMRTEPANRCESAPAAPEGFRFVDLREGWILRPEYHPPTGGTIAVDRPSVRG